MLLYQKRGLQSWNNCSIVHKKAKKKTRRNSAAPPTRRELFTKRISGFSDSRFLCYHLVEIEDVITPRKIILFKYKTWTEQRIRCRQKCRYFEELCFSFRGRTQINSKRGEQLRQSNLFKLHLDSLDTNILKKKLSWNILKKKTRAFGDFSLVKWLV